MKQQPPNVYIEKRGKNEYWRASWRVEGETENKHLGPVGKMTREEATEKACKLKLGYVVASHTPNIEKIKADRAALIAREAKRILDTPVSCSRSDGDCLPRPDPPVEEWKFMVCNTCGSDFQAYLSEAKYCPCCAGNNLRGLDPLTDSTINTLIWKPYLVDTARRNTATKRIDHLRKATNRSKHKPALTLREGWIDPIPQPTLFGIRYEMDLGDNDNYVIYAKCGDYEFQGFKTAEEAKNALINHCGTCSERKDRCWKPDEHLAISSNAPRL